MARAEFLFDFGSPNAYLAHKVLPGIEMRTGVTFAYVPILLGGVFKLTGNKSPMVAFAGVKNKLAYEELETRRFIARHNLTAFRFNPNFPVNTLTIMRGALAAEAQGCFAPYAEAVFRAMWEEGLKLDEPEVIRAALDRAGLDGAGLLALTQDPAVKDRLLANTEAAVARGVFGAPSFFVDGELFFGKDRLGAVEDELARMSKP